MPCPSRRKSHENSSLQNSSAWTLNLADKEVRAERGLTVQIVSYSIEVRIITAADNPQ